MNDRVDALDKEVELGDRVSIAVMSYRSAKLYIGRVTEFLDVQGRVQYKIAPDKEVDYKSRLGKTVVRQPFEITKV